MAFLSPVDPFASAGSTHLLVSVLPSLASRLTKISHHLRILTMFVSSIALYLVPLICAASIEPRGTTLGCTDVLKTWVRYMAECKSSVLVARLNRPHAADPGSRLLWPWRSQQSCNGGCMLPCSAMRIRWRLHHRNFRCNGIEREGGPRPLRAETRQAQLHPLSERFM